MSNALTRSAFRNLRRIPSVVALQIAARKYIFCNNDSEEEPVEVEMKIRGLMMDPITNMPIVILKEAAGSGILPIWVGVYEANAIALEIEKVVTPRPMTHDL